MNPVQGFKEMSAPKKAATVIGTAAVVGSVVLAAKKGKAGEVIGDVFKKTEEGTRKAGVKDIFGAIGKGYGEIAHSIKTGAQNAWATIQEHLPKAKAQAEEVADDFIDA